MTMVRRRPSTALLALFLAASPALALAPGFEARTCTLDLTPCSPLWVVDEASRSFERFMVGASPDGSRLYMVGIGHEPGEENNDFITTALDTATGDVVWRTSAQVDEESGHVPFVLAVSPDGAAVFVSGMSEPETAGEEVNLVFTLAYDAADGTELWRDVYGHPEAFETFATALHVSHDASVAYVLARAEIEEAGEGGESGWDVVLLAYDAATGQVLWEEEYDREGGDYGMRLGESPDGETVYAAVEARPRFGPEESTGWLVAFDAHDGEVEWDRALLGENARFVDLAVGPDGDVFVVGSRGPRAASDMLALSYSDEGDLRWLVQLPGIAQRADAAKAALLSHDGKVLYVGGTRTLIPETSPNAALVALDAEDGALRWLASVGSVTAADLFTHIALSPDGKRVYGVGSTGSDATGTDFLAAAFDADLGLLQWAARHDAGPLGQGMHAAVSGDGTKLLVTGNADDGEHGNNRVAAFDTRGRDLLPLA